MASKKEGIDELMSKYQRKLERELDGKDPESITTSREYHQFRKDMMHENLSLYEKWCKISASILNLKPDQKESLKLQNAIDTCHLQITPAGAKSFSIFIPLLVFLVGVVISVLLPLIIGVDIGMFAIVFFAIGALAMYGIANNLPYFMASTWRLKASNEMVISVFYVVTYMRHTSNLENALIFASEHLTGPLALDFRKVMWDVETEKFNTVKESLDHYLENWKETNSEFVEAFHLIESSLYESSDDRRLTLLDKSLDVILDETYEKMLHYAHNLHSPITMLHMLGVILPILGLVILPLMSSFMTNESLTPTELAIYIAVIYNIAIPLTVYYFGKTILATRPTGYGDTNLGVKKDRKDALFTLKLGGGKTLSLSPFWLAVFIGIIGVAIAFIPILMHVAVGTDIVYISPDNKCDGRSGIDVMGYDNPCYGTKTVFEFLGYKYSTAGDKKVLIGPYGLGAAVFSLFLPLALGLSLGVYYTLKSRRFIKTRENIKKLEDEFASSLFQLGNRLGDGFPAEIAFMKVADVMKGSVTGSFFSTVSTNIQTMGLSVRDAIFDPKIGALVYYPSNLIESSMKVLVESARKGPQIAAQALLNISRYVKEIHRVNERLQDLMAEIISSMKSQISFMLPVISGIVVGITSMVTYILSRLKAQMSTLTADQGSQMGQFEGILKMFGDGIPTYYTQIIIGIYVIEITILLTVIMNSIENGSDKLNEQNMLGKNLMRTTVLYVAISFLVMVIFNSIAGTIIKSMV